MKPSQNPLLNLNELLRGENPVEIAKGLIGVDVVTRIGGITCRGTITETEAYWAPEDQASHAKNHRRTQRTATFYRPAGTAYVYLCYGIHQMLNVITGSVESPHAVLIRALEPQAGIEQMLQRRRMETLKPQLTAGPGVLSQAMGINRDHNGCDLLDPFGEVRLEVTAPLPDPSKIVATPRIGIAYAGSPWVEKPWRFYRSGTPFVSQLKAQ